MSYYKILGLSKEPFSTSPDPTLCYNHYENRSVLYRLCVSVKLKRGLSLVLGDVGVGKTTLSRQFIQVMRSEPKVEVHMFLNPVFETDKEFLLEICQRFNIEIPQNSVTVGFLYNKIENYLFTRGVRQGKTIVILVDEAQKLTDECLEVLRGLLNYETNEHKLVQVILFSQVEIISRLLQIRNLWDRISTRLLLKPLDYSAMCQMISYRLAVVGFKSPVSLFTKEAMSAIFLATGGFPRKVVQLCHDAVEHLVVNNLSYIEKPVIDHLVAQNKKLEASPIENILSAQEDPYERAFRRGKADARRAAV